MALCVWWVGWAGGDSNSGSVALGRDWLVGGNVLKKGFLCVFGKKTTPSCLCFVCIEKCKQNLAPNKQTKHKIWMVRCYKLKR